MLAFAGNSLLCRIALRHTAIDPATFTTVRLLSGAFGLGLIARWRDGAVPLRGNWLSALALFTYAAAFSWAYASLGAGTGALLLFGSVQASMIRWGLWQGDRLSRGQAVGLMVALGGLVALVLPGLTAPPWQGSLLMVLAGVAWAVYTIRGQGQGDPLQVTTGNFVRAALPALVGSALALPRFAVDAPGLACAIASGALASGVGYAVWYSVLPGLRTSTAASVQLSVPVLAALGGIVLLGEPLSLRLALSTPAILGGIALVVLGRRRR